jgi:hypothetical protein
VHAVGKLLQRLQASGIDGCHIAESKNNERRQFWSRFCDVPEIAVDTAAIVRDWQTMELHL